AVAGGERAGNRAPRPGTGGGSVREPRRGHGIGEVLFRQQPPGLIDARSGDVRMDIDAARHHDHPASVQTWRAGGKVGDDAVTLDAHVAHLAVHAVRGIVHLPAADAQLRGGAHAPSRSRSERSVPAAVGGPASGGRNGSGTSSIRNAVPPSWIPATPVSTATAGRNDAALARGPMATLGSRASPPTSGSGTLAAEPITQAASISPAATSAAAPAWGR